MKRLTLILATLFSLAMPLPFRHLKALVRLRIAVRKQSDSDPLAAEVVHARMMAHLADHVGDLPRTAPRRQGATRAP
jgi:hypothetical protein